MKLDEDTSFAEGIRMINSRGALVRKVRFTKAVGRTLLEYIGEFKEQWYVNHNEKDDTEGEDNMQNAMQWIVNQVNQRWSQNELFSEDDLRKNKSKSKK